MEDGDILELNFDDCIAHLQSTLRRFLSGPNQNWPKDAIMGRLTAHAAHYIQQFP